MEPSTHAFDKPVARDFRPPATAEEIFGMARTRELALSRLLTAYVTTGLIFMLFPGTLLGVWNLLKITSKRVSA